MKEALNICLMGYGRMGKLIQDVASLRKHNVSTILKRSEDQIKVPVDVCIDFSSAHSLIENVKKAIQANASIVIGTTGIEDELKEIEKLVKDSNCGCVYSSNFSIGMQLFFKLVRYAGELFSPQPQYDVGGLEIHHHMKKDHPSGSAKKIVDTLLESYTDRDPSFDLNEGGRKKNELHFSSLRIGANPGFHQVQFDSAVDVVTLTHEARSREGFALGAVVAAEKIFTKKGFYSFEELL